MEQDFAEERAALVRSLEREGIRERRVLDAIARVPRERFVPPSEMTTAYVDAALPIGEGQTISQPYVVARMTELLGVRSEHHVLEVGTGSGYQAAVLAELARDVVSVERRPALAEAASQRLRDLGYTNVRVVTGDASTGFPEEAPYDRILVAAATPALHPDLAAQCKPEGRIVAPVGDRELQQLVVRHGDGREERDGAVKFVPLLGTAGFSDE
ncbi:MAG: protein-L-isoaspartate(D-aspartate) O-methyltransferase [Chloroflexota bacterium]|nr:protein-L-isoaspartate(D-aspartate) O-methyltransferase [Chloroflexota bacterium]